MTPPAPAASRRADARRNRETLLAAGRRVFVRAGADAPMDDVAKEAGVSRGTLYRHFPTREHLIAAIMADRADALDARARELLEAPDAWQALTVWLRLYDRSAAEYRGMTARVGEWLADDASPVGSTCAPMRESFAELLARARREGAVRPDVGAVEVLSLVSALPKPAGTGTTADVHFDIVLRGLRP